MRIDSIGSGHLRAALVFCVLPLLLLAAMEKPARAAKIVSLEDVNIFPELYTDGPCVMDQVELDGKIEKDHGYYCLGVGIKGLEPVKKSVRSGDYCAPLLDMSRATFVAPPALARKLIDKLKAGTTYPAGLTFTVEKTTELGNDYWIATVSKVVLYAPDGAVNATVE